MPTTVAALVIIILFVIPGFILSRVLRWSFPRPVQDQTMLILESIMFSCIIYAFFSPVIYLAVIYRLYNSHPYWFAFVIFMILFTCPVLLGFLISGMRLKENQVIRGIRRIFRISHPILLPWDYHFGKLESFWVYLACNDGTYLAGLYGPNSFASSYPAEEEIYLEKLCKLNEAGRVIDWQEGSRGAIISMKNVKYISFYDL